MAPRYCRRRAGAPPRRRRCGPPGTADPRCARPRGSPPKGPGKKAEAPAPLTRNSSAAAGVRRRPIPSAKPREVKSPDTTKNGNSAGTTDRAQRDRARRTASPAAALLTSSTAMTPSRHRACHFRLLTASPPRLHSMQPGRGACLLLNGKEGPSLPLSHFLRCIDSLIRPLFPGQASFSPWAHRICKRKGVCGGAHGVPTYRERLCRAGPARPAEVQRVTVAG